ncbi:unnamed protein product, partial [Staurois parvus]
GKYIPLQWRSVGRIFLTVVVSGKNIPLHWWSVGIILLTLDNVSGKYAPYIDGQWKEYSLHWGENVPYIGDQGEECSLHW